MSYVIALDFEAAGGIPRLHGFTQLGGVIVRVKDGVVLSRFNEYACMIGYEWEERCVKEFWEKHPERFEETKKRTNEVTTRSPYQVVALFFDWVRENTKEFKDDVHFISDNVAFDVAILRYFSNEDILYVLGKYTDHVDVSNFYMGMSMKPVTIKLMDESSKGLALESINKNKRVKLEKPKFEVSKDHNPVNDAEAMALYWCFIQKNLDNREYCFDLMDGTCIRGPDKCRYSHDIPPIDSKEYSAATKRKNEYLQEKDRYLREKKRLKERETETQIL
jgi:hypothetical protein